MSTTSPHAAREVTAKDRVSMMPKLSPGNFNQPAGTESTPGFRHVARQPILDAAGHIHGFELLFRAGPTVTEFSGDSDTATRTVLDNTVIFGLENLSGGLPIFVNCTREAILERLVLVLPAHFTVLELLETLEPTPELLAACRELKSRGFRIALDDFVWDEGWRDFLPLADYIKVDLEQTTPSSRKELFARIEGRHIQMIAERVESHADLEAARLEGFTLFQGYFFCRPRTMESRSIPSNRLVHLNMLHALHEDPLNTARVSNLVKQDAALTYRVLKLVNSPLYPTQKTVTSIQGALVLIGDETFRRVAVLAITSELRGNQSSELLRMAFLRGKFCELAAAVLGYDATEQYLLGILSLLPAMLSVHMDQLVKALPLRAAVRDALLGTDNPERAILKWLECYERAEWEPCDELALSHQIESSMLARLYAEAMVWADQTMSLAV